MNIVPWTQGTWTRDPVSVVNKNGGIHVSAAEGSDWWRTTAYGFIHDDGHALIKDFPNERSMEVAFILDYAEQFDQCGIFITHDDSHWIKAAVEFCDGFPQVGAVVTNELSDWSTGRVSEWVGKEVTMRISRSGDAVTVRASVGDDQRLVRVAPLDPTKNWKAGPMVCAPSRAGLTVTITKWSEGAPDDALH